MGKPELLPAVVVEKQGERVIATAAMSLKTILKQSLFAEKEIAINRDGRFPETSTSSYMERFLNQQREAFLNAIATWPSDTVLELRLASLPNLASRARGTLEIFLLLRTTADSPSEAKARIISRYLALKPLVFTFMPEAEFEIIQDETDIRQALAPFRQTRAMALTRKTAAIPLTETRDQQAAGFGKAEAKGTSRNELKHLFPWIPALNDWSMVCTALIQQIDPYAIIVRLRPSAFSDLQRRRLAESINTCEWFLSTGINNTVSLDKQISMLRDALLKQAAALANPCVDVGVFITGPRPVDASIINILANAISGPCHGNNGDKVFMGGSTSREVTVADALDVDFFPETAPFTTAEAAAAFRLPSPPGSDWTGLPVRRFRTAAAIISGNKTDWSGAITLCENVHQGVRQPITLGPDDRMRHTFILGQTGTGKSTLMENMIVQDIENGQGVAVIDPHGDMAASVVGRIPEHRLQDVILFDVMDRENPIGMNILKWGTPEERDLLIDELYLTVDRIYDMRTTGGPVFEANFRGMLQLLMGSRPRDGFVPTVLDFPLCFQNEDFLKWLMETFEDTGELDAIKELKRVTNNDYLTLANMAPYITSKLNRFLTDQTIRRIVGQESCLDFDDIMNNRKILLVSLGKGRFGNVVSALLANHIVTRFKLAAMKRGDLPPENRTDFFLYVDECHNLPPENFCELLSEARKYRMGLVLATQYAAQLNKTWYGGDSLLSAIFGNVGTKLTFRLGPEDAQLIAPMLEPVFSYLDIIGLSNWHGYAHTQINNEVTPPFSFRSSKTNAPFDKARAKAIRALSQSLYGLNKNEVDRDISGRRYAWEHQTESTDNG